MKEYKEHPLMTFGMKIVGKPMDLVAKQPKFIRVIAVLFWATFYLPIMFIGFSIAFVGMLCEIYNEI